MALPTDAKERKRVPIVTGVLDYFPRAIAEIAKVSLAGNNQHHAGEPLHWDKSKSTDEADALGRHLLQRGTVDIDGIRHSGKLAWRALALLERELEAEEEINQEKRLSDVRTILDAQTIVFNEMTRVKADSCQ